MALAMRGAIRRTMQSSFSASGSVKGLWNKYLLANANHPVKTAMGSSLVLWALGDAVSQRLDASKGSSFNTARFLGTAVQGCVVGGGLGSLWYSRLHHIVTHTLQLRENTARFVLAKFGLECLVWQPAVLLSFWVLVGLVEGHPPPKIRRELQHDFLPSLLSDYALFAPLDLASFRWVPVRYQVRRARCAPVQ